MVGRTGGRPGGRADGRMDRGLDGQRELSTLALLPQPAAAPAAPARIEISPDPTMLRDDKNRAPGIRLHARQILREDGP